jgi:hypothetical protein
MYVKFLALLGVPYIYIYIYITLVAKGKTWLYIEQPQGVKAFYKT